MTTFLAFIIVLGVLVFVHELGHFLAAKWAGIHVHRFSVGLGAPIKALTFIRGGTEYSVSWIPLGGYVKMASREEQGGSDALEGGTASLVDVPPDAVFEAKPVWKRIVVILAGVVMNILFAWVVYAGLLWTTGERVTPIRVVGAVLPADSLPLAVRPLAQLQPGDTIVAVAGQPVEVWEDIGEAILTSASDTIRIEVAGRPSIVMALHRDALEERVRAATALIPRLPPLVPVVGAVTGGRPAAAAGMAVGDTVLAVDGIPTPVWSEVVERISERPGQEITVSLARAGTRVEIRVTTLVETVPDADGNPREVGRIGFAVQDPSVRRPVGMGAALVGGWGQTVQASTQVVRAVRGLATGRVSTRELGGPIQIGQMAGETARLGGEAFLLFMALISVNLAVMNLLPIPVLDGGQFLFLVGEAITGRPLSAKLRERFSMVGLALILMLMVLAFSNDIRRLLGWM